MTVFVLYSEGGHVYGVANTMENARQIQTWMRENAAKHLAIHELPVLDSFYTNENYPL